MSTRLGNKTLGQLIANLQIRAKLYTDKVVPGPTIKELINDSVDELHGVLGEEDYLDYRDSVVIPISGKQYRQSSGSGQTGTSFTKNTRTLVLMAAPNTQYWINDVNGFDSEWLNAVVQFRNINNPRFHSGRIQTVVNAYTVILKDPIAYAPEEEGDSISGNIDNTFLECYIVPDTFDSAVIDLASFTYFSNIDYISSIVDEVNGPCVELPEQIYETAIRQGSDSLYANEIIYNRKGDKINMHCGVNVPGFSLRTMNYTRTPLAMTANTDKVDLKAKHNNRLADIVLYKILKMSGDAAIPPDIASAFSLLMRQKAETLNEVDNVNKGRF